MGKNEYLPFTDLNWAHRKTLELIIIYTQTWNLFRNLALSFNKLKALINIQNLSIAHLEWYPATSVKYKQIKEIRLTLSPPLDFIYIEVIKILNTDLFVNDTLPTSGICW